ncbi:hypothetical protein SETIT_6G064300v2 [Setaria italica]|uniref:DUF4220 domain-containing protein n=1 Tax=Setaria italica TaxID=4555 RepID=K3YGI1_SETIT|nr:uncharacterized protein LOC101756667 [Setaria italica]RCV30066.1 hypothetical protein SETIT_6G064300v2 [Setaria italica]
MSLSSAVNWWEEWQLRILVLGSLVIQLYLAIFAPIRKSPSLSHLCRPLIWLSYLGGDALAIYALATLFNRQKKLQCHPSYVVAGSHDLEVLWAPILLIHLGGRMTISAYNIEDNELWLRHIGVAVSQVSVTVYVFTTSWSPSADKRLLAAAILLFVLGVFRCFEKPFALRRASFSNLVTSFHPAPWTETTNREVVLEKYIQEAADFVQRNQGPPTLDMAEKQDHLQRLSWHDMLFVDFAYAYDDRFEKLKSFWLLDAETGFEALRRGLSNTFNIIYTKLWQLRDENRDVDFLGGMFSILLFTITTTFPIASIILFHVSKKEGYRGSDIKVTYLLLYITYFSEIISAPARLHMDWRTRLPKWRARLLCPRRPVMVAQHSLIGGGLLARDNKYSILLSIGKCFKCQDFLRQHIGRGYSPKGEGITSMVRDHVKDGWIFYIRDVESYWEFNDSRGHLSLEHNVCEENLGWSIEKPFDESIIIWHVATDFCIHRKPNGPAVDSKSARIISNYMMYLLSAKPEMLLPGSRITLFNTASKEISDILQGDDGVSPLDKKQLTENIINKAEKSEVGFLHEAWLLAEALMQLGDDAKMWEVIRGVWVEMLCFSAGRCRGYLHAKSLCIGGEYLTFVSLLMSQAGLEIFPDKQQRMKLRLPKEQRVSIAKQMIEEANQPAAMVLVFGEENAATQPSASQDVVVAEV